MKIDSKWLITFRGSVISSNELETVYDEDDTQNNEDFTLHSNDHGNSVDVPIDSGIAENCHETDDSDEAVQYNSYDNLRSIEIHVFSNSVLNRPSNPTHFSREEWRFLQVSWRKCSVNIPRSSSVFSAVALSG